MGGDDEWTVVGGKGSKQRGKSKGLSLKAAEKLNEAQQEKWRLENTDAAEPMEGWGNPPQSRKRGKQASTDGGGPADRVGATEAKVTRSVELVKGAPFYELLGKVLKYHCFVPTSSSKADEVMATCDVEGSICEHPDDISPSDPWCTPGWKWAPGPQGPSELIIYGLGSPSISPASRDQLALALLLIQHHGFASVAAAGRAMSYDPVLSRDDHDLMRRYQLQPLLEDEKGARPATAPTLFYMPHCEAVLYDNLLKANWSSSTLPYLAILGNSFRTYEDRWEMKPKAAPGRPAYILAIRPHVIEIPLGDTGAGLLQGFTDTSLHLFPPSVLSALDSEFWD
mmetsp:Transcript_36721/g.80000  ORF Transcript_36721/g.80000 Transcript_36721/m.80000 type:complete len:339 (-) Transcript_36721:457-1473(-)